MLNELGSSVEAVERLDRDGKCGVRQEPHAYETGSERLVLVLFVSCILRVLAELLPICRAAEEEAGKAENETGGQEEKESSPHSRPVKASRASYPP